MGIGKDIVTTIDVKVRPEDVDRAPEFADMIRDKLGKDRFDTTNWKELNRSILHALELERDMFHDMPEIGAARSK